MDVAILRLHILSNELEPTLTYLFADATGVEGITVEGSASYEYVATKMRTEDAVTITKSWRLESKDQPQAFGKYWQELLGQVGGRVRPPIFSSSIRHV